MVAWLLRNSKHLLFISHIFLQLVTLIGTLQSKLKLFKKLELKGMRNEIRLVLIFLFGQGGKAPGVAGFMRRSDFTGQRKRGCIDFSLILSGQVLSLENRYMLVDINLPWPLPGLCTPKWFPQLHFGTCLLC